MSSRRDRALACFVRAAEALACFPAEPGRAVFWGVLGVVLAASVGNAAERGARYLDQALELARRDGAPPP